MNKFITLGQLVSAVAKVAAVITAAVSKLNAAISGKLSDAPEDGKAYVRQKGAWVEQKTSSDVESATDACRILGFYSRIIAEL